jgi:hypothetical protein
MHSSWRAQWVLAILFCVGLLIAPALWNHFPLLQWDTGGYLARWYEGYLVPSRAVVYGLILYAGVPFAFWPVLVLQAALTIWIVALMLRAHGLGKRPRLLAGTITGLAIATTLPWLTAILLTDIFCGLGVLALYLLLMRGERVRRGERVALIVLIAVAAATHSATYALLVALTFCAVLLSFTKRLPLRRVGHRAGLGVGALALGAVLVFAADYVVAGRLAWTPGGFALSFGRMLQDGIVKKYLDEHCPDARLRLCAVKDRIPQDADIWFWGSDLFDQMGRFDGLGQDMERIALESLIDYPGLQFESALSDTARQLVAVHTGEGVQDDLWHTRTIIERYTPQLAPAMRASHEQQGEISFAGINRLQYPAALAAMALLPLLMLLAWRGRIPAEIGEFAAAIALTLLGNAFICGVMSNPHDRYGARVAWLAVLAVILAIARQADDRLGRAKDFP